MYSTSLLIPYHIMQQVRPSTAQRNLSNLSATCSPQALPPLSPTSGIFPWTMFFRLPLQNLCVNRTEKKLSILKFTVAVLPGMEVTDKLRNILSLLISLIWLWEVKLV